MAELNVPVANSATSNNVSFHLQQAAAAVCSPGLTDKPYAVSLTIVISDTWYVDICACIRTVYATSK